MSKPRLIKKLKKLNPEIKHIQINQIIEIFSKSISDALIDGRNVELRDFGTFFLKKIKEKYSARNPKTGEIIYVPEKNKVRFRSSKKLKEFINTWKNQIFL